VHKTHDRARRRSPGKLIAAGLVGFAILAAACGDDGGNAQETTTTAGSGGSSTAVTPAPPSTTVAEEKPVPGGVLKVGVEAEVSPNWVPGQMQCDSACQLRARTFFEPLMALDTNNKLQPYLLAEEPTHNADYTVWTLKIRDGVTFHDGTKLDAAAAVKNLTRNCVTGFIGLAFQGIKGCGFGGKIEEAQTGIVAKDAMTIEVTTKAPYATFPFLLTTQGAFMSAPAWYDKVFGGDQTAGSSPVGTGPFVFDSWKPGDTLKVKKNPNYWRKDKDGNALPYLDGVEFRVIADELTRKSAFDAGQLDLMPTDNGENIKKFRADGQSGKIGYLEQSQLGETFYILLHVGQAGSPLQDKRVRCALLRATDKKTLAETTGAGVFPLANGLFSPGEQGYLEDNGNPGYTPDEAKKLMDEYIAEKGKPKLIYSTVPDQTALQAAELTVGWWKAAGADVTIQQIEQSKLITNALLGDDAFNAFGWRNHAGLVLDNQYFWWHSSSALPKGAPALNFGRMKDPEIDRLLDAARAEPDPAKQEALAEDVNRRLISECYVIPTTWAIWGIGMNPNIKGVGASTLPDNTSVLRDGAGFPGQIWLYQVWLKK